MMHRTRREREHPEFEHRLSKLVKLKNLEAEIERLRRHCPDCGGTGKIPGPAPTSRLEPVDVCRCRKVTR